MVYYGDIMTLKEIKDRMMRHSTIDRDNMIITPIKNAYGKLGSVLFSLNGTPPKGYYQHLDYVFMI